MIFYQKILLWLLTVNLVACASWLPDAHRLDVTQGNIIKRDALDRIQTGMKKLEITSILGNPMLTDPFHTQRWDYIYHFIPAHGKAMQSRLTLYFEGEVLVRIDDSEYREPESFENSTGSEPKPVEPVPGPEPD